MRLPIPPPRHILIFIQVERKTGFEPATPTLARLYSTTELLPHVLIVDGAGEGSRTPTPKALDPKSSASANSATPAYFNYKW